MAGQISLSNFPSTVAKKKEKKRKTLWRGGPAWQVAQSVCIWLGVICWIKSALDSVPSCAGADLAQHLPYLICTRVE